jgi:flagellar biosynthetic protein FliP
MTPVLKAVDARAVQPFVQGKITLQQFGNRAAGPLKEFMVRQTREEDLALMVEFSGEKRPKSVDEVSMLTLIPAFMLSELYTAFKIGFVIFLPFVLIDMVVASILMSMGMMMVPPMMISLPVKLLVFVLIDGWNLVVGSLLNSFA